MGLNRKGLQIGNTLGFIFTLVMNSLGGSGLLFNNTIGGVSETYSNLFTPAGLTFSIWGVIYLLLGLFIIYQARGLFKEKEEDKQFVEDIGYFFILISIWNPLWLIFWLAELILLSLIVMLLLLVSLILLYLKINRTENKFSSEQKFFVNLPFSLYLGWISIATIANVTIYLVSIEWNGFGLSPILWTVLIIIVALVLTSAVLITQADVAYASVYIWALIGIIIKQVGSYPSIVLTCVIAIIIVSIEIGVVIVKKKLK